MLSLFGEVGRSLLPLHNDAYLVQKEAGAYMTLLQR